VDGGKIGKYKTRLLLGEKKMEKYMRARRWFYLPVLYGDGWWANLSLYREGTDRQCERETLNQISADSWLRAVVQAGAPAQI